MSSLAFPLKDLIRRRFQTTLTIVGLTICVATTVFLIQFGNTVGLEIFLVAQRKLTTGFSYVFTVFIILVSFLAFLACLLITSFFVSISMSQRVQDIGVMKATGCLTSIVFGYFAAELFIMILVSCVLGTVFGVAVYDVSINMLNALGFFVADTPLNYWAVFFVFLTFLIAPNLVGGRIVTKWIKVEPTDALSPSLFLLMPSSAKGFFSSKLGPSLKVAIRNLLRRKSATIYSILCLTTVLMLTTITLAGGMIANQTTQNYVKRAISENIIVVGHPNMTERYSKLLSQFLNPQELEPFDYLDSRFLVSETDVLKLNSIIGVVKADPRFIVETTAYELPGYVIIDERTFGSFGDHRSSPTLVLGMDPEKELNEWLINGRILNKKDSYSAVIGDSLASGIFENPKAQSMNLGNKNFGIVGICLDPLNQGNVVYIPIKTMQELFPQSGFNLIFIKIDPAKSAEAISEIENETGLSILELNSTLNAHMVFLDRIWSLVMFLPLLTLATAALCLAAFMMLLIAGQKRDFGIMRALGAKPGTIIKIALTEIFIVLIIAASMGIFGGFLVTLGFLIPDPVLNLNTILSIVEWLAPALIILGLISLYPALKIVRESILKTINYP